MALKMFLTHASIFFIWKMEYLQSSNEYYHLIISSIGERALLVARWDAAQIMDH